MILRFRLVRMLLVMLLAGGFLAVSEGHAHAAGALASWYGPGFYGKTTASGVPYNPYGYTAASKTLPLGTELLVSRGGRSVQVTVNDRGPYVGARSLDLSQAAAQSLGLIRPGVAYVDYTVLSYPGSASTGYQGYGSSTGYATGSGGGRTYVVQPGDTLTAIAGYLGTSVGYLSRYNGLADPDYIQAGQVLYY